MSVFDPILENLIKHAVDIFFSQVCTLYKNKKKVGINSFCLTNASFKSIQAYVKNDEINATKTYSYGLHVQIEFMLENDNKPNEVIAYFSKNDSLIPSLNSLDSHTVTSDKIERVKLKRISEEGNKFEYSFPDQYLFMSRYKPVSKPILFVIDFKSKRFATTIGVLGNSYPVFESEHYQYGTHSSAFGPDYHFPMFGFSAVFGDDMHAEPTIIFANNKVNKARAKNILSNSKEVQTMLEYRKTFTQQLLNEPE